jgi:hypothetical protein
LIQDHQDLNFSYDVIWDALKQDHCEPYKFDLIFENEILKSIDIVSWSVYSFVGLTSDNPTKLINSSHIYVHERRVRI